jgi:uncharacterized protein YjbI with pentapeptide repeats
METRFYHGDLSGVDLSQALLMQCDFADANLSASKLVCSPDRTHRRGGQTE